MVNYTILEDEMESSTLVNETADNSTGSADSAQVDAKFVFILYKLVVPIIFGLITLIGVVGNLLVIYVIFSRAKMRTVTNLLLLNLAAADLSFVVICPPFTAYAFGTDEWQLGNIACKLMHYLLNVTVYVTIYTLVLISVIRYMTILYNAQTLRYRTKRNIVFSCLIIWTIMLVGNTPILLSYGQVTFDGLRDCSLLDMDYGKRIYASFFIFAYLLPLIVIAILSVCILHHINQQKTTMLNKKKKSEDKKKQASRLLILVVVIFAIFWLPVHIHLLVAYFGRISQSPFYLAVSVLWNVLAYFNSCVNPIIYNFASKEFRDSFREVVFCLKMRSRKRQNGSTTVITKTTSTEANNGEMKRLVSHVKDRDSADADCTKL